jgi:hypothetical protein
MLQMLGMGCSSSRRGDGLDGLEAEAVERLADAFGRLHVISDDGQNNERTDVSSDDGQNACSEYLQSLDEAANALGLQPASRSYRQGFSANYKALFPDGARRYRVDIFEASIDQDAPIYVNGDKFQLSTEAIGNAEALQQAWSALGLLLTRWRSAGRTELLSARPARAELAAGLSTLDHSWAQFESRYVSELIWIEGQARSLFVDAIQQEEFLTEKERIARASPSQRTESEEVEARRKLVGYVARLNAVANVRRKGRDDLGAEIFESALSALKRCNRKEGVGDEAARLTAARILANDVVESFTAMRKYLRQASQCLERVDPHLCNNPGLVTRLVDWEESWEVGSKYVQEPAMLGGICDVVAGIREAEGIAPALGAMIADFDAELFLVLPRLLLLRFLGGFGENEAAALVQNLLPHRWDSAKTPMALVRSLVKTTLRCRELEDFIGRCRQTINLLTGVQAASNRGRSAEARTRAAAWAMITRRAVDGPGGEQQSGNGAETKAIEDLMHELERWSMELQRHCPEDWNQCSAVLVRCLTSDPQQTVRATNSSDFTV